MLKGVAQREIGAIFKEIEDMPFSYRKGSFFIPSKKEMPWQ